MKTIGTKNSAEITAFSDFIQQAVLVAGTAQAFDTPNAGGQVNITAAAGMDVYVRFGSTAAVVPTTSTTGGSTTNNNVLNPGLRNISSTANCTVISLVSTTAGVVTIEWWSRGST